MKKAMAILLAISLLATVLCIGAVADMVKVDDITVDNGDGTGGNLGEAMATGDDYKNSLTFSADISSLDMGGWGQLNLYLDSKDNNNWNGYRVAIQGQDMTNNAGIADTYVSLVLYEQKDNVETEKNRVAIPVTWAQWNQQSKTARLVVQRVVGETETTIKVWMALTDAISAQTEPLISYSVANADYSWSNIGSKVQFAVWNPVKATISNIQYTSDVIAGNMVGATTTTTEETTTTTTVVTPSDESIHIVSAGNTSWDEGEVYLTHDNFETYAPILTAEFDVNIADLGEWAQLIMYLDSWDCNPWGGFQLRIEGGDAAYGNTGNDIDADYAITLYQGNEPNQPAWKYVDGVALENLTFNKDYTMRIERVVGETETTLKVWLYEKGAAAGAPIFTYTGDWDASAGVKFTTWDRVDATVSNLKLYDEVLVDEEETTTTTEAPVTTTEAPTTTTEADTATTTTTAAATDDENPDTGVVTAVLPLAALMLGSASVVVFRRKKD